MYAVKQWLIFVKMAIALITLAVECLAGTPHEKALAAVAVARVRVSFANSKPELKDSIDHFIQAVPETPLTPEQSERRRLENELDASRQELAERQKTVTAQAREIAQLRASGGKSPKPPTPIAENQQSAKTEQTEKTPAVEYRNGSPTLTGPAVSLITEPSGGSFPQPQPMRIEFASDSQPVSEPPLKAQLVVKCWTKGCKPGERQKRDLVSELTPLGWSIGTSPDCQILFVDSDPTVDSCPRNELYQNGNLTRTWNEYTSPAVLSTALRQAWDGVAESIQATPVMASGSGGSIHAKAQIQQCNAAFRQYIGDGVTVTGTLDRSGASSLPLLARDDWSWIKLLGASGHFQVDAKGAVGLPFDRAGFGYRIRGDDVEMDADGVLFVGLLKRYQLSPSQAVGVSPAGLFIVDDIITIGSFISAIHTIRELLWPSVDLTLPGQIAGTAVLNGETLTIEFQQPVTVRIQMLFTFNLAVKKVVLTDSNVHVEFSGSRWIRSRDFAVQ